MEINGLRSASDPTKITPSGDRPGDTTSSLPLQGLALLLGLSERPVRLRISDGLIPLPDWRANSGHYLWTMKTLHAWNPEFAARAEKLLGSGVLPVYF